MGDFLTEYGELLADTVTVEPHVSTDASGAKTYGAAVTYRCHIDGRARLVRDNFGEQRAVSVAVYLAATPAVTQEDRLTLPAPYSPTQPPIIAVRPVSDEAGWHHQVLYA